MTLADVSAIRGVLVLVVDLAAERDEFRLIHLAAGTQRVLDEDVQCVRLIRVDMYAWGTSTAT